MKTKYIGILLTLCFFLLLSSCSTNSNIVLSKGVDLSKYKYIVFGRDMTGDGELADIVLHVENAIANTYLEIVNGSEGLELIKQGHSVLSPNISAKSEKWDGGHTFITVTLYDYDTGQMLAVLKSSGIGMSISEDQRLALSSIKKELYKAFGQKQKEPKKDYSFDWY